MKTETIQINVPGQVTGAAVLTGYILDAISVAPERRRPVVIVCAGGGYRRRSDRESQPIAMEFLAMGYHACILDYSVAPNRFPTAVRELAEAVAQIREHADQWMADSEKIIVCGFSAAGHLACSLGVFWNDERVCGAMGRRPEEVRPDGMILCYPVITGGEHRHAGSFEQLLGEDCTQEERDAVSLERFVTKETPRAFIWHTVTDPTVPVESSLYLAAAMRRAGVNFELHIYPTGGHGLSLASEETAVDETQIVPSCQSWIPLVRTWMEQAIMRGE